ncbi:MAG: alpha-L-fucosidase [Terriglobia bacterium]|jgi:alpha-L-fucosidase
MAQQITRRTFLKTTGAFAVALATPPALRSQQAFSPSWDSLTKHTAPAWFDDAKFGIYFHWGPYSVPAFDNEWYSRNMYIEGQRANAYHKLVYGPPSKFGYKDFIPMFRAEKFNSDEWADLLRKAGAKFAGPVTEHADGFSMWDSKVNKWNAAAMGPCRDVVGEMSRALRNQGLRFISTFHHQWLWGWYPTLDKSVDASNPQYSGLYGPPAPQSPFRDYDKPTPPPPPAFQEIWEAKVREVIDKYRPSLIYFDSRLNIIDERRLADLISYYYDQGERWGEEVSVTYKEKDLPRGAGILDIERGRLDKLAEYKWLTDDAIDWNSWCHVQNANYKTAHRILGEMIDIVSKNGCFLLDITPTAEGVFPQPVVERLLAIGEWLSVNGEAIHGTRPWKIFGEGPTQVKSGMFGEEHIPDFGAEDFRFTSRWKTLYAITLDLPSSAPHLLIKSLNTRDALLAKGEIANVSLLGSDAKLSWEHSASGLQISLPQAKPAALAYAFKILLN